MIVTIDGPAGAGKSTVARRLAERLGFRYVDTGAMYRAVTWLALERGIDLEDEARVASLAAESPISLEDAHVLIAGRDATEAIRVARIDRVVSTVARHQAVRRIMRERQRELAESGDSVVEGRDIGSVVCPGAEVKVWLEADPDERARRRRSERPEIGADALATDLRLRDQRDAAQMRAATDAEVIDTTDLTVDDVVARIERLVEARAGA